MINMTNQFNENFLKLLKTKSTANPKLKTFMDENHIELADKDDSVQGYMTVYYEGHQFVISKSYNNQTALYVNDHNLGVDYKHFNKVDFEHIANVLFARYTRDFNKHQETNRVTKYKQARRMKALEETIVKDYERDIQAYEAEIERKKKAIERCKQTIEAYDEQLEELTK